MTKRMTPSCDEHEHADGCLCGTPIGEHDATLDRHLSEAVGGVEGDRKGKGRRKVDRTAVKGDA